MTNGLAISIEDLKKLVGELTIEIIALRQENQLLKQHITALQETAAAFKAIPKEKSE